MSPTSYQAAPPRVRDANLSREGHGSQVSGPASLPALPENRSGRGAVSPREAERKADEVDRAGTRAGEVEAFHDPDAGTEKHLVRLLSVAEEAAHGEVVDSDQPHASL